MTPDQAERIKYRRVTIRKLLKAVRNSTDEDRKQRARWIMEDKRAEIDRIRAEPTPSRT